MIHTEISLLATGIFVVKLCKDIFSPGMLNPTDFVHPLPCHRDVHHV